jgi:hypothetical protein
MATTIDMREIAKLADGPIPESPIWWLERLTARLLHDQPRMILMDRYYRGDHPLPFVPSELRDDYRRMLADARLNFMRIVVTSPAERLKVQGFRPRGSEVHDKDVWSWWLDNRLDVDSNLTIVNALSMGRGYVFVRKDNRGAVKAQAEDPRMTIVAYDPDDRHRRVAGLRLWYDDWTCHVRADLWLTDACYRFVAQADHVRSLKTWPAPWTPAHPVSDLEVRRDALFNREEPAASFNEWSTQWVELDYQRNPSGEIPIVAFVNQPSTLAVTDGESELDDVWATQNRINENLFNRQLAAWTAAYQQKWATGIDIPVDPKTGKPVMPYKASVTRLFTDTSPDAKFGAFPATDLGNYIKANEADIKGIAVVTRTPRHYLVESGQTPSGDSIKSAEAGLVAKVNEKSTDFGHPFSEVARLRAVLSGQSAPPMETIWADPEFRTFGELTDGVIKQKAAEIIPLRVAREQLGYSPSEIQRMETLDAQEALVRDAQSLNQPTETEEEVAEELQVPVGA